MLQNLNSITHPVVVGGWQAACTADIAPAGDPNDVALQFDKAMTDLRKHYAGICLARKISFALKQREIEMPMVEYAVSFARASIVRRHAAVERLTENVELGPGHLSVNRAKQALKEIASATQLKQLVFELKSEDTTFAWQAAQLLGWLKDSKAIDPLLDVYTSSDQSLRPAIAKILRHHFSGQFEWHVERLVSVAPDLSSLITQNVLTVL
jgi:hypothetical protein